MMAQIVTMGLWLTVLSFVFLKLPVFDTLFESMEQKLSAYFVLFIWSALFNAFNVRSDSFDIFKDLKLNPGFMRVFVIIVLGAGVHRQRCPDPRAGIRLDQQYVQLCALPARRVGCRHSAGVHHDPRGHPPQGDRGTEVNRKEAGIQNARLFFFTAFLPAPRRIPCR